MSLQIHITAGGRKGQRLALTQGPIVFGRDPQCPILIDTPNTSRQHGQLEQAADGSWQLTNLSANGTVLGRKKITKKPRAIAFGETPVKIGNEVVFEIIYQKDIAPAANPNATLADAYSEPEPSADETATASQEGPAPETKKNNKLIIGLAAYLGVMFIGIILAMAFLGGDDTPTTTGGPTFEKWNDVEVKDAVYRPNDNLIRIANPTEYDEHIKRARSFMHSDMSYMTSQQRLAAYMQYREALAHASSDQLEDGDDRYNYDQLCDAIAKELDAHYDQIVSNLEHGRFRDAVQACDHFTRQRYPDLINTPIGKHILELRAYAYERQ